MKCNHCIFTKNELELIHEEMQILKKNYIKLQEEYCKLKMREDATRN